MNFKKYIIAATLCCCNLFSFSQNRNSIWCFGDSAGIDHSIFSAPVPISTGMDGRGSCVSIADSVGDLLFYAETRASLPGVGFATTIVFNANHQVMFNGDSIIAEGWYHELIILPDPANSQQYYLFCIAGIAQNFTSGLFYSKIDMTLDGGLGAVTQKNIPLQTFDMVDCLSAVKHGNGRDWWLVFRKSDYLTFGGNNDWYSYLISPAGITNFSQQSLGAINRTSIGQIDFSTNGDKMAFTCLTGVIEVFDFDRCTGAFSNLITIEQDPFTPPYPMYWGVAFSNDNSKLYVTSYNYTGYLLQFDMNSSNIDSTKDTLWSASFQTDGINVGKLKRMDDGKIYLSCAYDDGNFYYPYPDSIHNYINENLSVINSPDSLDTLCNFQPFSFYLGGKRTYYGLPNNPDYELAPLAGSICDTLTSIPELIAQNELNIFPNPFFNKITFQYGQHNSKRIKELTVFNLMGEVVFNKKLTQTVYELDLSFLQNGVYFVSLKTDKSIFTKKIVKL